MGILRQTQPVPMLQIVNPRSIISNADQNTDEVKM